MDVIILDENIENCYGIRAKDLPYCFCNTVKFKWQQIWVEIQFFCRTAKQHFLSTSEKPNDLLKNFTVQKNKSFLYLVRFSEFMKCVGTPARHDEGYVSRRRDCDRSSNGRNLDPSDQYSKHIWTFSMDFIFQVWWTSQEGQKLDFYVRRGIYRRRLYEDSVINKTVRLVIKKKWKEEEKQLRCFT